MRILACFKIVRDLENVIDSDWKSAKDAGFRIDYTKKLINDVDDLLRNIGQAPLPVPVRSLSYFTFPRQGRITGKQLAAAS